MAEKLPLQNGYGTRARIAGRIRQTALMESPAEDCAEQCFTSLTGTGVQDPAIATLEGSRAGAARAGATFTS